MQNCFPKVFNQLTLLTKIPASSCQPTAVSYLVLLDFFISVYQVTIKRQLILIFILIILFKILAIQIYFWLPALAHTQLLFSLLGFFFPYRLMGTLCSRYQKLVSFLLHIFSANLWLFSPLYSWNLWWTAVVNFYINLVSII